jgi:hypothetical protein
MICPCLDAVAGSGALAVDAQLAGPRHPRDGGEVRLRQVALEPAVEADAVILFGDGELTDLIAHRVSM